MIETSKYDKEVSELHEYYKDLITQIHNDHQKEIAEPKKLLKGKHEWIVHYADKCENLEQELAKIRGALEKIVECEWSGVLKSYCVDIAKSALKDGGKRR